MFLTKLGRLDRSVSAQLFAFGRQVPRCIWKILEYSGDGIVWLAVSIVVLILGLNSSLDDGIQALELSSVLGKDAVIVGMNLLLGLVIDLCEVGLLKWIAKRPRPVYNSISNDMNVIVSVDAFSFPSGHSSRVSFLAQFAILLDHKYSAHGLIVAWALIVAISRCMMGRHYLTDVIAGLALGSVTLLALTRGSMDREVFKVNAEAMIHISSFGLSRSL